MTMPSVDLAKFTRGDKETKAGFVQSPGAAYEEVGFVAVKNHGISAEVFLDINAGGYLDERLREIGLKN